MKLKEFLESINIDYSSNRISNDDISFYEDLLETKIGPQLSAYLIDYGYIGYKQIEMLGINAYQKEESDLIKTTVALRKSDSELRKLIAIENQGDGDYYLVDESDQIYRYILSSKDLIPLHIDLESYIVNRIMDA